MKTIKKLFVLAALCAPAALATPGTASAQATTR